MPDWLKFIIVICAILVVLGVIMIISKIHESLADFRKRRDI
jgi:hypothetical protein